MQQGIAAYTTCREAGFGVKECTWVFWHVVVDCMKNPIPGPPPPRNPN